MSGFSTALCVNSMKASWAKAVNIIAVLVVGFLLTHHLAAAQSLDDATALTQQVIELIKLGRVAEAVPLAQRALAIREKTLGLDHPDVATALYTLAILYQDQGHYASGALCSYSFLSPIVSSCRPGSGALALRLIHVNVAGATQR